MKKIQKKCAVGMVLAGTAVLTTTSGADQVTKELQADQPAFMEMVPFESDELKISVSGEDTDPSDGYTLQLHAENHDKNDIAITLSETAVNDFMCDTDEQGVVSWAVPAGQELDMQINWSAEALSKNGIREIDQIVFRLMAYTYASTGGDYLLNDRFTIRFGEEEEPENEQVSDTDDSEEAVTEEVLRGN